MKTIPKRFLQDPDWHQVEELVLEFINPLLDLSTIDTKLSGEDVRAEVLGRQKAYDALIHFTRSSGIIRSDKLPEDKPNIFR